MFSARRFWVFSVLCVLALMALMNAFGGREASFRDPSACSPTWQATVPLEFHEHDATVPVTLEGHATQFAFDTGASDTYVTGEAQRKFDLKPATGSSWRVDTVDGSKTVDQFFEVADLRFAGLAFGPRAMPLTDLGYAPGSPARAVEMGLLGSDLLKGLEVDLDIPDKRIVLYRFDASCEVRPLWSFPYVTIPITLRKAGTPMVALQLNGVTVKAVFDTGSDRTTLDYDEDDEDEYAKLGEAAESDPKWLHSFAIGGHPQTPFDIAIGMKPLGSPNQTRLGIDFIGRHRFWLSLASKQLFLANGDGGN